MPVLYTEARPYTPSPLSPDISGMEHPIQHSFPEEAPGLRVEPLLLGHLLQLTGSEWEGSDQLYQLTPSPAPEKGGTWEALATLTWASKEQSRPEPP